MTKNQKNHKNQINHTKITVQTTKKGVCNTPLQKKS